MLSSVILKVTSSILEHTVHNVYATLKAPYEPSDQGFTDQHKTLFFNIFKNTASLFNTETAVTLHHTLHPAKPVTSKHKYSHNNAHRLTNLHR